MSAHNATTLRTGHVGLNVSDVDRSTRFYRDVFDFTVMGESQRQDRRFVFLGEGGTVLLTLWQQGEGRFDKHLPGLHHLSFQVPAIEDVHQAEQRLRRLNVPLIYDGIVPHAEGTQSGGIFFEDPDGIRLEIYAATGAEHRPAPSPDAPSCGFF
ncbi:MAG TPA: VOC family protein [Nitrospiraceae bacterium]|nr:VOC family protein [Nitrospiraceae bacterium]